MSTVPTAQLVSAGPLHSRAALPVFVVTIGLSAFLLFGVQPFFAKLVLPILGGSPAVWSVATVVFQCLLLAGYAYAHALAAARSRTSVLIHLGVLALASLALPIGLAPGWHQAPAGFEVPWLAALMLCSIGLPFFVVAANGPLLQAWFARTGHPQASDPYFLYAASNIGSFGALAAYPFLIEPTFRLREQSFSWSLGFAGLAVLIAACGTLALRGAAPAEATDESHITARPTWRDRLVWIALSAVPAGLLVGVTAHISTDIAPIPLLWIVPLGLYLASFVVAFKPGRWIDDPMLTLPRIGLTIVALPALGSMMSFEMGLALHLVLFTATALVCHRMLYRMRPDARHLTGFYLALSVGGAIGGLLCGVAAPLVFNTVAEYPILLVAALACRPDLAGQAKELRRDVTGAVVVCAIALAGATMAIALTGASGLVHRALLLVLALFAIVGWRSAATSLVAIATVTLVQVFSILPGDRPSESVRSFFGIHRVSVTEDGRFRQLSHGTTLHGAVRIREDDGSPVKGRPEPTTYYTYEGVIGRGIVSARAAKGSLERVSAVGLGTGSLACHRQPSEGWTFYEIDDAVVRIARDPSRFPFLAECGQGIPVVVGDARLTLNQAAPGQNLIVLDAFSSDSIPFHLLTREAIGLYLSRLAPDGVILMHVSNRHLDLTQILARTAAEHGLVAITINDRDGNTEPTSRRLRTPAKIVMLTRDVAHLGPIATDPGAVRLMPDPARRPWTDDFSNILEALWDGRAASTRR